MTKTEAIKLLGGTHQNAKAALGYKSVQAVYQWPEILPASIERQVIGFLYKPQFDKKQVKDNVGIEPPERSARMTG